MTAPVVVHLGQLAGAGQVSEVRHLSPGQLSGWDCIPCGTTQVPGLPFVPVGWVADHGQVFTCAGHEPDMHTALSDPSTTMPAPSDTTWETIMPSTFDTTMNAVVDRLRRDGLDPADYSMGTVASIITMDWGVQVQDVSGPDWLHLIAQHALIMKTQVPCPSWCQHPEGHPYEFEGLDGHQSRYHSAEVDIAIEHDCYVGLTVEETRRVPGDDSTIECTLGNVLVVVDRQFDSSELRQLAATMLNAADKLDEVTR